MARVSVIMGIYNCATTLPAAIDSILNQTYTDWQLIMCDDGSKDNTFDVAMNYQKRYPEKIVLLKNEKNMKLAASLNRCLEASTGEYIARMDADDESFPERLEKEVAYLDSHPEIACVGTGRVIFDESGDIGIRRGNSNINIRSLVHGTPFAHPTIMMRKYVYDDLGGYTSSKDTLRAEDVDLWVRFLAKGYQGFVIQEPLYRYRESLNDFKKRNMRAAVGTTRVYLRGYKTLKYPLYVYPFAFKPILGALIPNQIMCLYHRVKDKK